MNIDQIVAVQAARVDLLVRSRWPEEVYPEYFSDPRHADWCKQVAFYIALNDDDLQEDDTFVGMISVDGEYRAPNAVQQQVLTLYDFIRVTERREWHELVSRLGEE
jgi:hypothetical protein